MLKPPKAIIGWTSALRTKAKGCGSSLPKGGYVYVHTQRSGALGWITGKLKYGGRICIPEEPSINVEQQPSMRMKRLSPCTKGRKKKSIRHSSNKKNNKVRCLYSGFFFLDSHSTTPTLPSSSKNLFPILRTFS